MMPLNTNIALGIRPFQLEGPMDQATKALTLQGLIEQQQTRQMQMEQAKRQQTDEMQLRGVLQQTGGDYEKAMRALVASGTPQGIKLAGTLAEAMKDLRNPAVRNQVVPPGSTVLGPDNLPVFSAPKAFEPKTRNIQIGENSVTQELQTDGTWKEIGRGPKFAKSVGPTINNPAPVTALTMKDSTSETGWSHIDGRTGKIIAKNAPPPGQSQQAVDFSAEKARLLAEGKRKFGMEGLGSDLQQAEDLLMGQKRDSEGNVTPNALPTGSGVGSLVDSAAGFFGVTPSGAAEADSLKVVSGRLIQKIPRFEGPQSDKDVALYKQMSADAGNDKLPRNRRLMAVRKMREIYLRYETGTSGTIAGERRAGEEPPLGAVRRKP